MPKSILSVRQVLIVSSKVRGTLVVRQINKRLSYIWIISFIFSPSREATKGNAELTQAYSKEDGG